MTAALQEAALKARLASATLSLVILRFSINEWVLKFIPL
jgi:hypothetical protein